MSSDYQYLSQVAERDSSGMELSLFLKKYFNLTNKEISRLKFREKGILLNKQKAYTNMPVQAGDLVEIRIDEQEIRIDEPEKPEKKKDLPPAETGSTLRRNKLLTAPSEAVVSGIRILYEDEFLFAVSKPQGLVCHPSKGYRNQSLYDLVKWKDKELRASDAKCIGRLDIDTSGIVLFAKTTLAAARLWRQRDSHQLKKIYLALCEGEFSLLNHQETICLPIGQDPLDRRKRMINGPDSREAVTHYQVLAQNAGISLVRCTLETGRTHQIRVHMAAIGHPLVGDPFYGHGREGQTRALLHCRKVSFLHPITGAPMEITCDLPEDFARQAGILSREF